MLNQIHSTVSWQIAQAHQSKTDDVGLYDDCTDKCISFLEVGSIASNKPVYVVYRFIDDSSIMVCFEKGVFHCFLTYTDSLNHLDFILSAEVVP